MDLAVVLPLAAVLAFQVLVALLLLAPRAVSKHVSSLLLITKSNQACSAVMYTTAAGLAAVTLSSLIQFLGIQQRMSAPQYDGALALTIEELRALLAVVLGTADLTLLFTLRALADEQQTADKASLNLAVLRKQALGQQSEYMRATTTTTTAGGGDKGGSGSGGSGDNSKSEVSKLIAEKQALYRELDAEKAKAEAAAKDLSAVKEQAKGLTREYDRLLAEHDKLQRQLARAGGGGGGGGYSDKKSA